MDICCNKGSDGVGYGREGKTASDERSSKLLWSSELESSGESVT